MLSIRVRLYLAQTVTQLSSLREAEGDAAIQAPLRSQ
jgi:hypothetical protein